MAVGGVAWGKDGVLDSDECHPVVVTALASLTFPRTLDEILNGSSILDLETLLLLPAGVSWRTQAGDDATRLTELDIGLLRLADTVGHVPFALPGVTSSPVQHGDIARRRVELYSHALSAVHVFDQFMALYRVCEHAFLEGMLAHATQLVNVGRVVEARQLLDNDFVESKMIVHLFRNKIFIAGGFDPSTASFPYPPSGHDIYISCGRNPGFAVVPGNYTEQFPLLVYAVRCAIVHARSEKVRIEATPTVVGALQQHFVPDLLRATRALLRR